MDITHFVNFGYATARTSQCRTSQCVITQYYWKFLDLLTQKVIEEGYKECHVIKKISHDSKLDMIFIELILGFFPLKNWGDRKDNELDRKYI